MQQGGSFIDFIIIALMVWFIYSRFTSTKLPKDKGKKQLGMTNILPLKDVGKSKPVEALSGMDELKKADRSFKEKDFIAGATEGFRYFYQATSERDEDMLDSLTAPKLFDEIMDGIEEKNDAGIMVKTDVKEITSVAIVDTRINGRTAIIQVKYDAKLAEYEEDIESGKVVKNPSKRSKAISTIWTWARPVDSDDPNWELEEISALS